MRIHVVMAVYDRFLGGKLVMNVLGLAVLVWR